MATSEGCEEQAECNDEMAKSNVHDRKSAWRIRLIGSLGRTS